MTLDLRLVARAGKRRREALADAEAAIDDVVTHVAELRADGQDANVALAARELGVERSTIYRRLRRHACPTNPNAGGPTA